MGSLAQRLVPLLALRRDHYLRQVVPTLPAWREPDLVTRYRYGEA